MTRERYEDDLVGASDASGNATIAWNGLRGTWASLLLIAEGHGSPRWRVLLNGSPVQVGRGPRAPMTLPLLAPGDKLQLEANNATPNTIIKGHLVGVHSTVGIDDLPMVGPIGSTIAVDQAPLSPYDWSNYADTTGSAAQISAGGIPGVVCILDTLIVTLANNGAGAADSKRVSVWDGTFGTGTLLAPFRLVVGAAAGDKDRLELIGLRIENNAGNTMDIGFSTAAANQDETVFAGGFFR